MKVVVMGSLEKKAKYKLDMKIEVENKTISLNNKKSKLLQCIDKYGSIVKASKETGISYRTALKIIEVMEIELGSRIVVTKRGGKGGGGCSGLTDEGNQILFKFIKVNRVLKKHVDLNEIEGTVVDIDEEKKLMNVNLCKKEIIFPALKNFNIGDKVLISISPNNVFAIFEPPESSVRNMFEGIITETRFKNDKARLIVDIGGNSIIVDMDESSQKEINLNPGKGIFIRFNVGSADITKKI